MNEKYYSRSLEEKMGLRLKRIFTYSFIAIFAAVFSLNTSANPKYASLVIDADTGIVLHQENAAKRRHPASLVKMMTLYMTFHAIETGRLSMNSRLKVSAKAASQQPSKIGVKKGSTIKVRDAILALSVKSANDVAVVLAENIAGSERRFATIMNKMAKKLGMNSTHFKNASGLHHPDQVTNSYDMARLAVALRRDYRKYYGFFDRNSFSYKGKTYTTHNRVSKNYNGADGLKTGYINASGFNLVTSVRRSGESLVGVVMGGKTSRSRDNHMTDLLDSALNKLAGNSYSRKTKMNIATVPSPAVKPVSRNRKYLSNNGHLLVKKKKNFSSPLIPQLKPNGKTRKYLSSSHPVPSLKPRGSYRLSSPNPKLKPNV